MHIISKRYKIREEISRKLISAIHDFYEDTKENEPCCIEKRIIKEKLNFIILFIFKICTIRSKRKS
jgi:hypothetical protein